MPLECGLCEAGKYPVEAEMAKQELGTMTNAWIAAESEYVQRRVAEAMNAGDTSYQHYLYHRLTHLNEEIDRRMKIARYDKRGAVSQDTIKTIKERLPLERVIGQDIVLVKRGNLYLGRCPWHEDKHPSLTVYPDGHWWDYGCNVGGDVFDWLMSMGAKDFATALSSAAIMAGVQLTSPGRGLL